MPYGWTLLPGKAQIARRNDRSDVQRRRFVNDPAASDGGCRAAAAPLVLLPILHRTPDKQHADENDRHEQEHEHDNYDGGVDKPFSPPGRFLTPGGESKLGA